MGNTDSSRHPYVQQLTCVYLNQFLKGRVYAAFYPGNFIKSALMRYKWSKNILPHRTDGGSIPTLWNLGHTFSPESPLRDSIWHPALF